MKKSIFQFVSNNNINEDQTYKDNNISNNNELLGKMENKNTTSSLFGSIKDKNLYNDLFGNNTTLYNNLTFENKNDKNNTKTILGKNMLFENNNVTNNSSLFGYEKDKNNTDKSSTNNSNSLFGFKTNNNTSNSLFGPVSEKQSNNLFGNNNSENSNLFSGNNSKTNYNTSFFGKESYQNTNNSLFNNLKNTNDNLFENKKENISFNYNTNNKKVRNNINIPPEPIKKCTHEKDFSFYCIENSKNEGGLICNECLYKYHKKHIDKCLLLEKNCFENYKKYYKQYINRHKMNIKKMFDEIISKLDEYENEEIDNISNLFEEKVNLDFELPVELSFIERFEIAINRKIFPFVKDILFTSLLNLNCVNLFKNKLKNLKFSEENPNYNEKIILKSSIDFNLKGIGLPKIIDIENKKLKQLLTQEIFYWEKLPNLKIMKI